LRRVPDRFVFKIDVGDMSAADAYNHLQRVKSEMRKKTLVDPSTGHIRTEVDPLGLDEDIYIPVRPNGVNDVSKLPGGALSDKALDVDYMRKRLFGCLRVPPAYLGFAENEGALLGKSPLETQDVQFARSCKRLQQSLVVGFCHLFRIHLCFSGVDPQRADNDFIVLMNPVSYLEELQRAETTKVRVEIVEQLLKVGDMLELEKVKWLPYVLKASGLSQEDISQGMDMMGEGRKDLTEAQKEGLDQSLNSPEIRDLVRDCFASQIKSSQLSEELPRILS